MTLDEARAALGQRVTHHATGTIEGVTAQFIWVRYDGSAAAQPMHPDQLTLAEAMPTLEDRHRIALARELTAAAGFPLRDRWGFAVGDDIALAVVNIVFAEPDNDKAADQIGMASICAELGDGGHIAMAYDTPTDEEYERAIVTALRPLVEQRRDAAARSLP